MHYNALNALTTEIRISEDVYELSHSLPSYITIVELVEAALIGSRIFERDGHP